MRRIGLFGGSFDPVHTGHLLVAMAAMEELALDRLVFVPAAQSPFKPGRTPASPKDRLAMLRLAAAGRPRWTVDSLELERGGVSYTADTLETFRQRHPDAELFCVIGGDHVASLHRWRRAEDLAKWTTFVVAPRPGETIPSRDDFRIRVLRGHPAEISSSALRRRRAQGLPLDGLAPERVVEHIEHNRLYL